MPTNNPRINLNVPPDVYASVKRLSKATGLSMSAIVMDVIEPLQGYIDASAGLAEKVKKLPAGDKPKFIRLVNALEYKYADRMLYAQEAIEDMEGLLSGEKTEVQLDLKQYLHYVDKSEVSEGKSDAA